MSGLFKNKKTSSEVEVSADPYKSVREPLLSYLGSQIGQSGKKYSGETVAGLSDQEKKSLSSLDQYANQGTPATTQAVRSYTLDMLQEKDPTKSPVYQAVKAEAGRNLEDTQRNIASNAAGGGRYYTGARVAEQGRAATSSELALNTLLAQVGENQIDRQVSSLPFAAQLGESETNEPLQKTAALQTYGALPRAIQQAIDQADLEEFLRSEYDYPLNIAALAQGVQQAPLYSQVGYTPSMYQQFMSGLQKAG